MNANESKDDVLDPKTRAYLSELAAEIVANGNPHGDMLAEMELAHDRRQAFGLEMQAGETNRAKKARRLLSVKVYGDCLVSNEIARIEQEEAAGYRLRVLSDSNLSRFAGGA